MLRQEIKNKIKNSITTQVDLSELQISDEEIREITQEIIELRPNVQEIFLDRNKITDQGAQFLGENLAVLAKLSYLGLQGNEIDEMGAHSIFALKLSHPDLKIGLNGNKISNHAVMEEIAQQYNASGMRL